MGARTPHKPRAENVVPVSLVYLRLREKGFGSHRCRASIAVGSGQRLDPAGTGRHDTKLTVDGPSPGFVFPPLDPIYSA